MSQKKAKVPAFSGVIVTRVSWSGTMSVRMPKSGILKPWTRSIEVSTNVTGCPRFTFTVSGENSNFEAWIATSPGAAAFARNTTPSAALLPISSAMKSLRFMGLGLGDRQFGDRDLASPPIATSRVPSGFSDASNGGGGGRLGALPGAACGKIRDFAA